MSESLNSTASQKRMATDCIELRGVRVHNLQNIDVNIPLRKLTVIVGVSGSGKSSLAFDTLYAEGQRRYIDSFSAYARQFLDRLQRPDADRIDRIPPAIAIKQSASSGQHSGRSTVSTETEIYDYLRLLYAKIGIVVCPKCDAVVNRDSPSTAVGMIDELADGVRYQVGFPLTVESVATAQAEDQPETVSLREQVEQIREDGFSRAIAGGATVNLTDYEVNDSQSDMTVVVDRLVAGQSTVERLTDSIETSFRFGEGRAVVIVPAEESATASVQIDGRPWIVYEFNDRFVCSTCSRKFLEPEHRLFSFNSPLGACPDCSGTGQQDTAMCTQCNGTRLSEFARAVRIDGQHIGEFVSCRIDDAVGKLASLVQSLDDSDRDVSKIVCEEIDNRLNYLSDVGLGYITLDRRMKSLSGGERQRVSLTAALGSSLVNTLYVLDEPSAGLHPTDSERVIRAIERLRRSGNTVVVVEHEEEFLRHADHVIEIGPAAGRAGGQVVFHGTPSSLISDANSVTGNWLTNRPVFSQRDRRKPTGFIKLEAIQHHNLNGLSVEIPVGALCVVTGVSGAGKSSLVHETLFPAICDSLGQNCAVDDAGKFREISGCELISGVVMVDQHPVGRTARSNPVTYLKAFDEIRKVFAMTAESKLRNFTPSTFSFNSKKGGRCPKCEGHGSIKIDMQFLADLSMLCPECNGRRYRADVLEAKYRGLAICDVLEMTVDDAFTYFRGHAKLQKRLQVLRDVGLGYLPLGQPATTLSGGESQRLKLAAYMAGVTDIETADNRSSSAGVLFLLDEPTNGLHGLDVATLLKSLDALVAIGHSLMVIEHHLGVIRHADYIIDLGPGPGEDGGTIVATGTPEEVARVEESATGRLIRECSNG